MANIKYFSGTTPVQYFRPFDNAVFATMFPGVKGSRFDGYQMLAGKAADGTVMPITRMIDYKSNPSKHKCSARCLNATGRQCECECGGANHGAGH